MAMQFNSSEGEEDQVMATINTTPLVDVMLVLLIIFLITIPVVTHTVPVKLPNEVNQLYKTRPENINLAVNQNGEIFWNAQRLPNTDALLDRLKKIAVMTPQPELHIRGDQETRYAHISEVVQAAQRAGIVKVGFITEPPARGS